MSVSDNTVGYLALGGVIIVIIAYFLGMSNGESEEPTNEYTDSEYLELQECFDAVNSDMNEINDIAGTVSQGLGNYEELSDAATNIEEISSRDYGCK